MSEQTKGIKLTKRSVEAVPVPEPAGYDERGRSRTAYVLRWDTELRGFGLRVTSGGARSYIAERAVRGTGRTRRVTLGRHGDMTAEQARRAAQSALSAMGQGYDPAEQRRADRAQRERAATLSTTLAEAVEQYLADRDLKPRTVTDTRAHLDGTFKDWRDRPLVEIGRDDVSERFRAASAIAPTRANQAFRVLRSVLNYARAAYRTPDDRPILVENPVDVLSQKRAWNAERARNTYVPLDRLGKWWSAVQARRADPALSPVSRTCADVVAFLALTGLRKGEAMGLRWADIDLDDASFHLADSKNRNAVTLPLSQQAVELLSARPADGTYVFPGQAGDGSRPDVRDALAKAGEASGVHVTPHDLRRTFRAVSGKAGVELWRAKALMNHVQRQDVTLAHYVDLEDVRYLRDDVQAVADHLDEQRRIAEAGNVTPMRAAEGVTA